MILITVNRRRLVRLACDVKKILLFTFYFGHVTNIVHGQAKRRESYRKLKVNRVKAKLSSKILGL